MPTVLIFGENDQQSVTLAKNYLEAIETFHGKKEPLKGTGTMTMPKTDLTGGRLLGEKKPATDRIIKQLNDAMENRGSKEWKQREEKKYAYVWTIKGKQTGIAKSVGEEVARPIPPQLLRLGP